MKILHEQEKKSSQCKNKVGCYKVQVAVILLITYSLLLITDYNFSVKKKKERANGGCLGSGRR